MPCISRLFVRSWMLIAPAADSVRVSGSSDEFLVATRSLRTRGMFTYGELPDTGAGGRKC